MSEWVKGAGDLVSSGLSFSVANWAIPVARGVAIGAGGHTAPLIGFGDYGLITGNCQNRSGSKRQRRRAEVGTVYVDKYELPRPYPKSIRVTVEPLE